MQQTRTRLAQGIQANYKYSSSGSAIKAGMQRGTQSNKKFSLKSKQHDEFAILNYYTKVSKYDLDRANMCMNEVWRHKQERRVENAKAKREMINSQVARERFVEVNTKVRRIRDLSNIKMSQKQERRDNAIRHQEMLKSFLDTEKAARKDDRPLQYADPL